MRLVSARAASTSGRWGLKARSASAFAAGDAATRGDGVFARYLDHARRGAEEARRGGASERVARLIERHHLAPRDEHERMLHQADREALP